MVCPLLRARVEQRRDRPGLRIDRSEIATLVAIALKAGEGQVVQSGLTTVLDSDDMIDFVWVKANLRLVAVFAPSPGALYDGGAKRGGGRDGHYEAAGR